jgi:hypothetical protein
MIIRACVNPRGCGNPPGHRPLRPPPPLAAALSRAPPPLVTVVGLLPPAVTMTADIDAAALWTQLEAIVKEAEDTEEKAAAACRRVQAARLLLEEEETKAAALEQTATTARQRVLTPSAATSASQIVPTTSSSYEDTVVASLHLQAATILNVRQLVNIVLDSSTNYASWRDLMEQALQRYALIKHVTDDTPSNDSGWIRIWAASSSTGSATLSRRSFTKWFENAVARHTTCGLPSITVSNVLFILTPPFAILFRATSRCLSTAASSRPWPTVSPTSTHPSKTESSSSTFFKG